MYRHYVRGELVIVDQRMLATIVSRQVYDCGSFRVLVTYVHAPGQHMVESDRLTPWEQWTT